MRRMAFCRHVRTRPAQVRGFYLRFTPPIVVPAGGSLEIAMTKQESLGAPGEQCLDCGAFRKAGESWPENRGDSL